MGRIWAVIVLVLVGLPVVAMAGPRPAEAPPPDYPGDQYIDSNGCVFRRDGDAWAARLQRDGQTLCGYPPSLALRHPGHAAGKAAVADAPPRPSMEEALAAVLAEGLRDGELVGDYRPAQEIRRVETQRPAAGSDLDLAAMAAAAPGIRAAMAAGARPNSRLCALLGHDGAATGPMVLGGDPTRGFCGGLTAPQMQPVLSPVPADGAASPDGGGPVAGDHRAVAAMSDDSPAMRGKGERPDKVAAVARSAAAKPGAVTAAQKPAPAPGRPTRQAAQVEMVPHWARYVQLGAYDGEKPAQTVIRWVAGMGYPMGRKVEDQRVLVLAGPFDDRRALIAALNDLRGRGFDGAIAR